MPLTINLALVVLRADSGLQVPDLARAKAARVAVLVHGHLVKEKASKKANLNLAALAVVVVHHAVPVLVPALVVALVSAVVGFKETVPTVRGTDRLESVPNGSEAHAAITVANSFIEKPAQSSQSQAALPRRKQNPNHGQNHEVVQPHITLRPRHVVRHFQLQTVFI